MWTASQTLQVKVLRYFENSPVESLKSLDDSVDGMVRVYTVFSFFVFKFANEKRITNSFFVFRFQICERKTKNEFLFRFSF